MIPDSPRHLGEKLQHAWQHLPLRGLGLISGALPMVAVVFSAAMAFVGNQQRGRMERAVTRHFEMVEAVVGILIGPIHHGERGVPTAPRATLIGSSWVDGTTVRDQRLRATDGQTS